MECFKKKKFILLFLFGISLLVFVLHTRFFKCRVNPFKDVALILVFNSPYYQNIPLLHELYDGVFGKVLFCGQTPTVKGIKERPDIVLDINHGNLGYHCAAKLIQLYPGYAGYLYGNDDMIINWWNLVNRDKNKIWQGPGTIDFRQTISGEIKAKWIWWHNYMGLPACQKFYKELFDKGKTLEKFSAIYETALKNGKGELRCGKGWSDFFYIPQRLSKSFVQLSDVAYKHRTFLEIAVNNILRSLDDVSNFEIIGGVFLPDRGVVESVDAQTFWRKYYDTRLTFIHPFKFGVKEVNYNVAEFRKTVIVYSKSLLNRTYCDSIQQISLEQDIL